VGRSDSNVFGPVKKHPADKRLWADADVRQAVTSWLQVLDTHFVYTGIQALVSRWYKCLNARGEYVEVWCVPCAADLTRLHQSLDKVISIGEFVTVFLKLPSTHMCNKTSKWKHFYHKTLDVTYTELDLMCFPPPFSLTFSGFWPIETTLLRKYVCKSVILWLWRWNGDCLRWVRII
jgi:hypothetical protein